MNIQPSSVLSSKTWAEIKNIKMPKGFYTDPRRWELISEKSFEERLNGGFYK